MAGTTGSKDEQGIRGTRHPPDCLDGSDVDGWWVVTRKEKRLDMHRAGCVDWAMGQPVSRV